MSIAEMNEIKNYIDGNFRTKISIKSIAKRFNKSVRTLQRQFQEAHRQTIKDYIQNKRIEATKLLLEEPDITIKSIAEQLGYSNTSGFTKAFTRDTGLSPKQYRKIVKQSKNLKNVAFG